MKKDRKHKKGKNKTTKSGLKNGMWKTASEVGLYEKGMKQGTHITIWHGNKRTNSAIDYVDDIKHGTYVLMHSTGEIYRMCQYKDGKIDGTNIEFSYDQGFSRVNRCKIEEYVDGNKHGKSKSYLFRGKVEDGNFTLVIECDYVNGKKHGIETDYTEDGALFSTTIYSEGKRSGMEKYYHRNGALKKVINYKEGDLNGIVIEYREDGTIYRTCEYADGMINGKEVLYSENGDIEKTNLYVNGKFVSSESKIGKPLSITEQLSAPTPIQKVSPIVSWYYHKKYSTIRMGLTNS